MTAASSSVPASRSELLATLEKGDTAALGANVAADLVGENYKIAGAMTALTGERDENFRVKVTDGEGFVFKIFGRTQSPEDIDLLVSVLRHLEHHAPDLPVPRLRQSANGSETVSFTDPAGERRHAVMYSFLPGKPLIDAQRSPQQHRQCGQLLAQAAASLVGFDHPAARRWLVWDLRHLPAVRALLPRIDALPFAEFVRSFVDDYAERVADHLAAVPHQFVHNDFNARNIIVDVQDDARVNGIIDFGDSVRTARIADVAIGVTGQLSGPEDAETAMAEFVAAYQSVSPLRAAELELLPWLVAARIVQNVIMTSWYRTKDPEGHFAPFDAAFFEWRVDFAKRLSAAARASASPGALP